MQSRPAAETGFQKNEADGASCPVPDEPDALRLQPRRAQSAQKIGQPLRLVDQKKASAPSQRACRCGAERVKGTHKLAARDGEAVLTAQMAAAGRIVGRVGDGAVIAAGRDLRRHLPQIAAENAEAAGEAVRFGIPRRLLGGVRLDLDAVDQNHRRSAEQQKPQRAAPAAKIQYPRPRRQTTEIRQHHGISAEAKLCVRDMHADRSEQKLFHTGSNQKRADMPRGK